MYTLNSLQEKLEKARTTLREVEQSISRVDGKPSFGQRFPKSGGRAWDQDGVNEGSIRRKQEKPGDSSENRRRLFGVEENYARRRVVDESVRFENENFSRRRSHPSAEDDAPPRKRLFPSVANEDFEHDESSSHERRPHGAVVKSHLPDLSLSLKSRGRQARDRERQPVGNESSSSQHRSIFSRLSGIRNEPEDDDEEERILKRDGLPSLASRVQAIERPTPSREEVLASQKKDEASKQRDRRMFGALVGTLQQFRKEETQVKEREERRQKIEKKLEEDALKDKERLAEEKRNLMNERKRREADIKRIEWSMNRVREFSEWEVLVQPLKSFIQTKSKPHIFYMPKRLNSRTQQLLDDSANKVQEMVENHLSMLNEEIENSERKARRAAGELNDVDKENDGGNIDVLVKDEEAEGHWEDGHYGGDKLEVTAAEENHGDLKQDVRPADEFVQDVSITASNTHRGSTADKPAQQVGEVEATDKPEAAGSGKESTSNKKLVSSTTCDASADGPSHPQTHPTDKDASSATKPSHEKLITAPKKSAKSPSPKPSPNSRSPSPKKKSKKSSPSPQAMSRKKSPTSKRSSTKKSRSKSPKRPPRPIRKSRSRSRSPARRSRRSRSSESKGKSRSRSPKQLKTKRSHKSLSKSPNRDVKKLDINARLAKLARSSKSPSQPAEKQRGRRSVSRTRQRRSRSRSRSPDARKKSRSPKNARRRSGSAGSSSSSSVTSSSSSSSDSD